MPKIPDDMEKCRAYTASKPKPVQPNWDALRKVRNAIVKTDLERIAQEWGVPTDQLHTSFNPHECYCTCGSPNPLCEHLWNGPEVQLEDGQVVSASCSLCGLSAYSHDIRIAP